MPERKKRLSRLPPKEKSKEKLLFPIKMINGVPFYWFIEHIPSKKWVWYDNTL